LVLDFHQSVCSLKHSRHMASEGFISHDQFPADLCSTYALAGENVGEAPGDPDTAVLVLHRLMMKEGPCPHRTCTTRDLAAHGHYLNLINPSYRRVGIGVYVRAGTTWLTEDFTG
jgi:uncharacterized protein YkwD